MVSSSVFHCAVRHRTTGIGPIEAEVVPVSPGTAAGPVLVRIPPDVVVVIGGEDDGISRSPIRNQRAVDGYHVVSIKLDRHTRLNRENHSVSNAEAAKHSIVLVINPLGGSRNRTPIHADCLKVAIVMHGVCAPDVFDQLCVDNGPKAAVVGADVVVELRRQSVAAQAIYGVRPAGVLVDCAVGTGDVDPTAIADGRVVGHLGVCTIGVAAPIAVTGELTTCHCTATAIDIETVSVVVDKRAVADHATGAGSFDSVTPVVVYAAIEQRQLTICVDSPAPVVADLAVRDLQDRTRVAADGVVVVGCSAIGLLNHAVGKRQLGSRPVEHDCLAVVGRVTASRVSHRAVRHRTTGVGPIEAEVVPVTPGTVAGPILIRIPPEVIVVVGGEDNRISRSPIRNQCAIDGYVVVPIELHGHPRLNCQSHSIVNVEATKNNIVLIINPLGGSRNRTPIHADCLKVAIVMHGVCAPDVFDQLCVDNGPKAAVVGADVVVELRRQSVAAQAIYGVRPAGVLVDCAVGTGDVDPTAIADGRVVGHLGVCTIGVAAPIAVTGELTTCHCTATAIDIETVSVVVDKRAVADHATGAGSFDSVTPVVVYAAIEQRQLTICVDSPAPVVADLTVRNLQHGPGVASNGIVVIARATTGLLYDAVGERQFSSRPAEDDRLAVVGRVSSSRESHRAVRNRTPRVGPIETEVVPVTPGTAARAVLVRVPTKVIIVVGREDDRIRGRAVRD